MTRGGASGLGDSRVENLARLESAGVLAPRTLIRAPMLSQVDAVVRHASTSLNTENTVLEALSRAADSTGHDTRCRADGRARRPPGGGAASRPVPLALDVRGLAGLRLTGIGTNLACQSGVVPDQAKMHALSALAAEVEEAIGTALSLVSGGNSANLGWALTTTDTGRVDELRLGEAILLGLDPLTRLPVTGLRTDAVALVAELIEVRTKPATPWGDLAQTAFGAPPMRRGTGMVRQGILAVGRQDVEPDGLVPPEGVTVLGASSDHLVVDLGDHGAVVGDELAFGVGYGAMLRAMTSPFVGRHRARQRRLGRPSRGPHDQRLTERTAAFLPSHVIAPSMRALSDTLRPPRQHRTGVVVSPGVSQLTW